MPQSHAIGARRTALLAAVMAVAGVTGAAVLPGASDALAYLLPALLLLGALAVRCYPGERALLARISARRSKARGAGGASAIAPRPRAPLVLLARGGALIGSSLAVRPPPLAPGAPIT